MIPWGTRENLREDERLNKELEDLLIIFLLVIL